MLRRRLQEMTEVQDVSQHPELLEAITRDCPNSICLLASAYPLSRYTCLMHIFDFAEKPEYTRIASFGFGRVYAGPDFAHWLLRHSLLTEVSRFEVNQRDIVFYYGGGQFKHAGLLFGDGRIVSKWGIGHLFDHELFEVPESYGTEVRFYKRLSYDDAYDYFAQFAEQEGILCKEIDL